MKGDRAVPESHYTRDSPPRNSITPIASQRPARLLGVTEPDYRFVLHVPFKATTLGVALETAGRLADFFAFLPDVDQGETTVTYEGDQSNHHRIICDLRLPDGTRCQLRQGHSELCAK